MKEPAKAAPRAGGRAQTTAAANASQQSFKRALEAQSLGRLADAEIPYTAALKRDPGHVPALPAPTVPLRTPGKLRPSPQLL